VHRLQPGRCGPAGHATQPGERLHAELGGLVDVPEECVVGRLGPVPGVGVLGLGEGVIGERVGQGFEVRAPQAWGTGLHIVPHLLQCTSVGPVEGAEEGWCMLQCCLGESSR
jgi:hypothetical protein